MRQPFKLHALPTKLFITAIAALLVVASLPAAKAQTKCRYSLVPCSNCITPAQGIVAWWTGDGTAEDALGGNHGTLENGAGFTDVGKVGPAFLLDGVDDYVKVPASPSLNVGAGNGFTVEAWVNPNVGNETSRPIIQWENVNNLLAASGVQLLVKGDVNNPGEAGQLYANIVDTNGVSHPFTSQAQGGRIQTNIYQHVALTYDKLSGHAYMFLDGQPVADEEVGIFTPQTSSDLYIGRGTKRPNFSGMIDEVSVYNRALLKTEVNAIYSAGRTGKCRGRVVYASDLEFADEEHEVAAARRDLSIQGQSITLDGIVYPKGLGVHADSAITIRLDGQYSSFLSDINLDDETSDSGSVKFRVETDDGELLYSSGEEAMTGGSATKTINVNVTGKQTIKLIVNKDVDFNADHADWANARFVLLR